MTVKSSESSLAKVVAVGSALTSIFVVSGSVTDPVNAPKLLVLGVVASAAFGLVLNSGVTRAFEKSKLLWALAGIFLASGLSSVLLSESPAIQGFFGTYGRNNGLATYLFLVALLLSTATFSERESFVYLIKGLIAAGLVNIVYCLWVIVFGDFIGWNNPYGNILGTFGNPNFIGAFLGIFFALYLAYGISALASRWYKLSMLVVLPITALEIYESSAIQGRVVALSGIAVIGFFVVRSRFNDAVVALYSVIVSIIGAFALMGALQIGPLTALIYKTSVSLRGQYWLAGWNTGEAHPFTGVGMDAFGDWYRRSRDAQALEMPGVNTVVNTAHNVPLDMFAFGGFPLFLSYLAVVGYGAIALMRMILRSQRSYEPILVALTTSWTGYQLQSIISINQIGLAIWGWVLTGAVIAYEKFTRKSTPTEVTTMTLKVGTRNAKVENQKARAIPVAGIFALVGLLLAVPPIAGDSKWRSAQLTRSVQALQDSMNPSYFNPHNTTKFLTNIEIFEQNNLSELAHKYTLEALAWNSESFDLWRALYLIKSSTPEEKELAVSNMRRLDPLNSEVTAG
jgi:hypothetical protein